MLRDGQEPSAWPTKAAVAAFAVAPRKGILLKRATLTAAALCFALAAFGSFAQDKMQHDSMGKPETHDKMDKMGKSDKMGKKDKMAKDKMAKHDKMDRMEKPGAAE